MCINNNRNDLLNQQPETQINSLSSKYDLSLYIAFESHMVDLIGEVDLEKLIKDITFHTKNKNISKKFLKVVIEKYYLRGSDILTGDSDRIRDISRCSEILKYIKVPFFTVGCKKDEIEIPKHAYYTYRRFNIKLFVMEALHHFSFQNIDDINDETNINKDAGSFDSLYIILIFLIFSKIDKAKKSEILFDIFNYENKDYISSGSNSFNVILRKYIHISLFMADSCCNHYIRTLNKEIKIKADNGEDLFDYLNDDSCSINVLSIKYLNNFIALFKKTLFFLKETHGFFKDFIIFVSHNLIFYERVTNQKINKQKFLEIMKNKNYDLLSTTYIQSYLIKFIQFNITKFNLFIREFPKLIKLVGKNIYNSKIDDIGEIHSQMISDLDAEEDYKKYKKILNDRENFHFILVKDEFMREFINYPDLINSKKKIMRVKQPTKRRSNMKTMKPDKDILEILRESKYRTGNDDLSDEEDEFNNKNDENFKEEEKPKEYFNSENKKPAASKKNVLKKYNTRILESVAENLQEDLEINNEEQQPIKLTTKKTLILRKNTKIIEKDIFNTPENEVDLSVQCESNSINKVEAIDIVKQAASEMKENNSEIDNNKLINTKNTNELMNIVVQDSKDQNAFEYNTQNSHKKLEDNLVLKELLDIKEESKIIHIDDDIKILEDDGLHEYNLDYAGEEQKNHQEIKSHDREAITNNIPNQNAKSKLDESSFTNIIQNACNIENDNDEINLDTEHNFDFDLDISRAKNKTNIIDKENKNLKVYEAMSTSLNINQKANKTDLDSPNIICKKNIFNQNENDVLSEIENGDKPNSKLSKSLKSSKLSKSEKPTKLSKSQPKDLGNEIILYEAEDEVEFKIATGAQIANRIITEPEPNNQFTEKSEEDKEQIKPTLQPKIEENTERLYITDHKILDNSKSTKNYEIPERKFDPKLVAPEEIFNEDEYRTDVKIKKGTKANKVKETSPPKQGEEEEIVIKTKFKDENKISRKKVNYKSESSENKDSSSRGPKKNNNIKPFFKTAEDFSGIENNDYYTSEGDYSFLAFLDKNTKYESADKKNKLYNFDSSHKDYITSEENMVDYKRATINPKFTKNIIDKEADISPKGLREKILNSNKKIGRLNLKPINLTNLINYFKNFEHIQEQDLDTNKIALYKVDTKKIVLDTEPLSLKLCKKEEIYEILDSKITPNVINFYFWILQNYNKFLVQNGLINTDVKFVDIDFFRILQDNYISDRDYTNILSAYDYILFNQEEEFFVKNSKNPKMIVPIYLENPITGLKNLFIAKFNFIKKHIMMYDACDILFKDQSISKNKFNILSF